MGDPLRLKIAEVSEICRFCSLQEIKERFRPYCSSECKRKSFRKTNSLYSIGLLPNARDTRRFSEMAEDIINKL